MVVRDRFHFTFLMGGGVRQGAVTLRKWYLDAVFITVFRAYACLSFVMPCYVRHFMDHHEFGGIGQNIKRTDDKDMNINFIYEIHHQVCIFFFWQVTGICVIPIQIVFVGCSALSITFCIDNLTPHSCYDSTKNAVAITQRIGRDPGEKSADTFR